MHWLEGDHAFAARHEKSYAAAEAIYQVLAKRRPLSGGETEFLAHWEWLAERREHLECIWREPRFYYWTRTAFNLLGAVLGSNELAPTVVRYLDARGLCDPNEGLQSHLDDFKAFVLGAAWRMEEAVTFDTALTVALPWCMPASPWSLAGNGEVNLRGIEQDGCLRIRTSDGELTLLLCGERAQQNGGLQLCRGPELTHAGHTITFQPHAFNLPGMAVMSTVVEYGTEYQWEHIGHCEAALAAIERYAPAVYDDFWKGMRLVGLKPEAEGTIYNTSCSRLTGASILTAYAEPLVLAEDLIHEFHHNRLFAAEDQSPFFDNEVQDAVGDEVFYSPWREDPRPLYGLFHALHVFTEVGHFWRAVYVAREARAECLDYAAGRLARLRDQLAFAQGQLQSFAAFTPFGGEVFDELSARYSLLRAAIDDLHISPDMPVLVPEIDGSFTRQLDEKGEPVSVGEAIADHIAEFDVFGQVAQLDRSGGFSLAGGSQAGLPAVT